MAKSRSNIKEFGYQTSKGEELILKALADARHILKESDNAGEHLKNWAKNIMVQSTDFLIETEKMERNLSGLSHADLDELIRKTLGLENEISKTLKDYFSRLTFLLNQLQGLNPPLKSIDLEPFLGKIFSNRREVLSTADPLRQIIEKLYRIKTISVLEKEIRSQHLG